MVETQVVGCATGDEDEDPAAINTQNRYEGSGRQAPQLLSENLDDTLPDDLVIKTTEQNDVSQQCERETVMEYKLDNSAARSHMITKRQSAPMIKEREPEESLTLPVGELTDEAYGLS